MRIVDIRKAKTQLSRLIERVSAGEEIVIAKGGKPVARLAPLVQRAKPREPGALRGRIRIAKDFDAPLRSPLADSLGTASPPTMDDGPEGILPANDRLSTRMDYRKIITVEPGKRGGKPCIRGLRITVYEVLEYLASGMTQEQVLHDFPYLTAEDIQACLAYAADRERHLLAAAG